LCAAIDYCCGLTYRLQRFLFCAGIGIIAIPAVNMYGFGHRARQAERGSQKQKQASFSASFHEVLSGGRGIIANLL